MGTRPAHLPMAAGTLEYKKMKTSGEKGEEGYITLLSSSFFSRSFKHFNLSGLEENLRLLADNRPLVASLVASRICLYHEWRCVYLQAFDRRPLEIGVTWPFMSSMLIADHAR